MTALLHRSLAVFMLVVTGLQPLLAAAAELPSLAEQRLCRTFADTPGQQVLLSDSSTNGVQCLATKYAKGMPNYAELADIYTEFLHALETMQHEYFEVWLGKWPTSIDWTGAVVGTYLSSALQTISDRGNLGDPQTESTTVDNDVNHYFAQSVAYYFGENAFAFRFQAHDDMMWLVLGWLESIKFINARDHQHRARNGNSTNVNFWHGTQFRNAFAHRARIYYDIVSQAWDTKLCGGGLTWNPSLRPYKNAITNELFISGAVKMYLYHPGDRNTCPFTIGLPSSSHGRAQPCRFTVVGDDDSGLPWTEPHEPAYLQSAIDAYDWLVNVDMANSDGLYVDGYHVSNISKNGTGRCDQRNEMVYTYNQGVVLSGLRDLWESTGNMTYLVDGHKLVRNVIRATGWRTDDERADSSPSLSSTRGSLGRDGILTEYCDPSSTCNQDAQTFKGIFFQHLTDFCAPLPTKKAMVPGLTHTANGTVSTLHHNSCASYIPWVSRNAHAALTTRNAAGLFGSWWGAEEAKEAGDALGTHEYAAAKLPHGAIDYRNARRGEHGSLPKDVPRRFGVPRTESKLVSAQERINARRSAGDANDRGRGRTIETQSSGLAVLRALVEFVARAEREDGS